jgi:hypothetical protein
MWHDALCTNPQLPSDVVIADTLKCAVVLEALKDEPSVGANARPSLTASARAGDAGCAGRDEESGCQVEQRN